MKSRQRRPTKSGLNSRTSLDLKKQKRESKRSLRISSKEFNSMFKKCQVGQKRLLMKASRNSSSCRRTRDTNSWSKLSSVKILDKVSELEADNFGTKIPMTAVGSAMSMIPSL